MKTLTCNACGKIILETSLKDQALQFMFEGRQAHNLGTICATLNAHLSFYDCHTSGGIPEDFHLCQECFRQGVLHSLECAWRICHHEWVEDKCRKCGALNGGAQPEDFGK